MWFYYLQFMRWFFGKIRDMNNSNINVYWFVNKNYLNLFKSILFHIITFYVLTPINCLCYFADSFVKML